MPDLPFHDFAWQSETAPGLFRIERHCWTARADWSFIQHALDAPSLALIDIKRLDPAMKVMEGSVDDFAAELLRVMGYERDDNTRKSTRLNTCGQIVFAKTDVCLMDAASEILLLVQEDKTHRIRRLS